MSLSTGLVFLSSLTPALRPQVDPFKSYLRLIGFRPANTLSITTTDTGCSEPTVNEYKPTYRGNRLPPRPATRLAFVLHFSCKPCCFSVYSGRIERSSLHLSIADAPFSKCSK